MIQAEIEGVGTLEFPDGTDQAVIQRTVKQYLTGPPIDPHTGKVQPSISAAPPSGMMQRLRDYLGIREPKTTPLDIEAMEQKKTPFQIREEVFGTGKVEEFRRVVGKAFGGATGGITNLVKGYEENPETWPGAVLGAGAELGGFLLGPLGIAKSLTGTRLAPTASGLRGMAQVMTEGAANLGIASAISSLAPTLMTSETAGKAVLTVAESGTIGAVIGALFPAMGAVPTKPLRLAVSLAVMDKIRAGTKQWFTVDDVYRGMKDGTIDSKQLGEAAFGYLMDMYFTLKVPTMKRQLVALNNNVAQRISAQSAQEVEQTILDLAKRGDIVKPPEEGISQEDIAQRFGSDKAFEAVVSQTQTRTGQSEVTDGVQGVSPKDVLKDAMDVERMFNNADAELQSLRRLDLKKVREQIARATLDTSAGVKKQLLEEGGQEGREAVIRRDLIKGMKSKTILMTEEAEPKVWGDLSKADEKLLDRVIQAKRTVAIDKHQQQLPEDVRKDIAHPEGLGGGEHQAFLDTLKATDPERYTKLSERADTYNGLMNDLLDMRTRAGLLTSESAEQMKAVGFYSPRLFIQHLDPERTYRFGGQTISIPDSGLKRLDEGSIRALENNSRLLYQHAVATTTHRIARNEANQALLNLAESNPENGVIRKAPKGLQEAPHGEEIIHAMVDGKPQKMLMSSDMAKQWVESDPATNQAVTSLFGWLSGTKALKAMATGYNPEFALTNPMRDMVLIWLSTHEYSKHPQVFLKQIAEDLAATREDAWYRRGAYADAIREGLGMDFLTHQGWIHPDIKGALKEAQHVMGYVGETSEIWTRLALRRRALANGKPAHEATWIARNYLDFNQGGWAVKTLDNIGFPYVNASAQALRTIGRSVKENPSEMLWKVSYIMAFSMGLAVANRLVNKENWESVQSRDRANNWVLTTPFSYTDEEGNLRHYSVKLAKDQAVRGFTAIADGLVALAFGDKVNYQQITQGISDSLSVIDASRLPPAISALLGYYSNKDFWLNKDISSQFGKVRPGQEFTERTHPLLREYGKLTDKTPLALSPDRLAYLMSRFFTYGNVYTDAVGGATRVFMESLGAEPQKRYQEDILKSIPGVRRFVAVSDPYQPYRAEIEGARMDDQTEHYQAERKLDQLSEKVYKTKKEGGEIAQPESAVRDYIKAQPPGWQEGFVQRHIYHSFVYGIPERRFWLSMQSMSPEARALVYWNRWSQEDTKGKTTLDKQLSSIPGLVSDRFVLKLQQLKGGVGGKT